MHELDSRVAEVTVYQAGARVRRVAVLAAPATPTQLRIGGLPLALLERSLRVTVQGGALAADVRLELRIPPQPDATPDASAEPEAVRVARAALRLAEGTHARATAALAALAKLAPVDAPRPAPGDAAPRGRPTLDARLALAAVRRDRDRALRQARAAAAEATEAARAALAQAIDDAARASTDRAPAAFELRRAAVITLHPGDAAPGTPLELSLEYAVEAARWVPTYVARLEDDGGTLELRAAIAQATGEDWTAARLTLSTAAHQAWTELPELPSLRYGRSQPAPRRTGFRAPPVGVDGLYADWDAAMQRLPAAAGAPPPPSAVPLMMMPTGGAMPASAMDLEDYDAAAEPVTSEHELPPMPMAAPMAAPMMARSAPPPPGAPMAKRIAATAERASAPRRRDAATARHAALASADEPPTAGDELLDYAALRLAGPDEPRRGRLVPPGVDEPPPGAARGTYRDLLALARHGAHVVRGLPPPQGVAPRWPSRYDHAFAATAPLDVPADGAWHNLPLRTVPVELTMQHVVVPREAPEVFRVAQLRNPSPLPIIGGALDVYLGGEFLLSTTVGFAPPRAAIELGLGVEPRVKVARNARFDEESAGMLRGALKLLHEITIDVTSVHPRPIRLEVRERVPVPPVDAQSDDLTVTIDRVSHPWEPLPVDRDGARVRGGHRWFVDLPAGAKASRSVAYHIKIPAKNELIGGNRREA